MVMSLLCDNKVFITDGEEESLAIVHQNVHHNQSVFAGLHGRTQLLRDCFSFLFTRVIGSNNAISKQQPRIGREHLVYPCKLNWEEDLDAWAELHQCRGQTFDVILVDIEHTHTPTHTRRVDCFFFTF